MITDEISLISALNRQIDFCLSNKNYRCGVIVSTREKARIVREVLSNLLPVPNSVVKLTSPIYDSTTRFDNGSTIRILPSNESIRGHKFNGVIIEDEVSKEFYLNYVRFALLPITYDDKPSDRVFDAAIRLEDIDYSEKIKDVRLQKDTIGYMRKRMAQQIKNDFYDSILYSIDFCNKFKKEYEEMYNEYDRPIIDKEVDGKRYLLYEAWGIPKSAITHKTEFVNKTKDMYLNVNGKAEDEYLDFENDIKIHLPINTDIYDSFEVSVNDGMVRIVLHEIKNDEPELKDLSIGI